MPVAHICPLPIVYAHCSYTCIYLSRALEANSNSEIPPFVVIHSKISSLPEAHTIEVPPQLLGPGDPETSTGSLPTRIR